MFMRRLFPLIAMLLAALLWVSNAFSSTITFEITHNYTISISPSLSEEPFRGESYIWGSAFGNIRESWSVDDTTGGASLVSRSGGPWLNYMEANINISTAYEKMIGTGPVPFVPGSYGTIYQHCQNGMTILFRITQSNYYNVSFRDDFSYRYILDNATGNPFSWVMWSSKVELRDPQRMNVLLRDWEILDDRFGNENSLNRLSNIDSGIHTGSVEYVEDKIYDGVFLVAFYSGQSGKTLDPVPVPPAVWLLGSGLLGLVGWRRFRKS